MSVVTPPSDEVSIVLSADEALVLCDLLWRWSDDSGSGETPTASCFESAAELAVLNALCNLLEQQLTATFSNDYAEILANARHRLKPGWSLQTLRK